MLFSDSIVCSHRHDSHTDTDVCVEHTANHEFAKRNILCFALQFVLATHQMRLVDIVSQAPRNPAACGAQVVSKNKHERRKAAEEAEVLLVEERLAFEAWRDSLETVPTIKVRPELQRAYTRACDSKLARWQVKKDSLPAVAILIVRTGTAWRCRRDFHVDARCANAPEKALCGFSCGSNEVLPMNGPACKC